MLECGGRRRPSIGLQSRLSLVDVHSYVPYKGRVEVKVKQAWEGVLIRTPEWVHHCRMGYVYRESR